MKGILDDHLKIGLMFYELLLSILHLHAMITIQFPLLDIAFEFTHLPRLVILCHPLVHHLFESLMAVFIFMISLFFVPFHGF